MRDAKRIKPFCDEFAELWAQYPDLRFGQIMSGVAKYMEIKYGTDMFYYEDESLMEIMKEFLTEQHDVSKDEQRIYNCKKKILYPPKNFITYNIITDENDKYKDSVWVDECLANEIEELWSKGIKTCGCCCGHGFSLGFIQVTDDCIEQMEELGYVHYVYGNLYGGAERKDAFVPKTYGHNYDGYSEGYLG